MNVIVSLMAAGAKKYFSKEEFRRIRKEADARYRRLVSENKDEPKALKQHTGMNIFPAIAVYKTLVRHGMEKEAATDVVAVLCQNLRDYVQAGFLVPTYRRQLSQISCGYGEKLS